MGHYSLTAVTMSQLHGPFARSQVGPKVTDVSCEFTEDELGILWGCAVITVIPFES